MCDINYSKKKLEELKTSRMKLQNLVEKQEDDGIYEAANYKALDELDSQIYILERLIDQQMGK